jgi:hypothetical protein
MRVEIIGCQGIFLIVKIYYYKDKKQKFIH